MRCREQNLLSSWQMFLGDLLVSDTVTEEGLSNKTKKRETRHNSKPSSSSTSSGLSSSSSSSSWSSCKSSSSGTTTTSTSALLLAGLAFALLARAFAFALLRRLALSRFFAAISLGSLLPFLTALSIDAPVFGSAHSPQSSDSSLQIKDGLMTRTKLMK